MTTRDVINHALGNVRDLFNVRKGIGAFCVIMKDDRETFIPVSFSNDAQKDMVSMGIKDLVKRSNPDAVVYASEAWSRILSKEESLTNITRPSEHKDRVEMVMVQIEFRTGEKFGCSAKIIRTGSDVRLSDFEIFDAQNTMGRFVDFYPVAEKDKN
jgi:hypothetical protein